MSTDQRRDNFERQNKGSRNNRQLALVERIQSGCAKRRNRRSKQICTSHSSTTGNKTERKYNEFGKLHRK